ncbi:MAG: tetratricopeptide repeat protein [Bacteroidota bacterium]
MELASIEGDSLMISRALTAKGFLHRLEGNHDSTLICYQHALDIASRNNFREREKFILNQMGSYYGELADYGKSLKFKMSFLRMNKEDKDSIQLALAYNNVGLIYYRTGNYLRAIEFINNALDLKRRFNSNLISTYINLGLCYTALEDYQEAINYYDNVSKLCNEDCDTENLIALYHGYGLAYENSDFEKSKNYFEQALKLSRANHMKLRLVVGLYNLSRLTIHENSLEKALKLALECQQIASKYQYQRWLKGSYKVLSEVYSRSRQFELAYDYQRKYDSLNEIITGSEVRSKMSILEQEVQESEMALLKEKEAQVLKSRNQLLIGSSAGVLLLGGLAFFFYRSNHFRKRANKQISKTLKELRATQDQLVAQEKMAALGQLVSGIAHEINTPLGAIQGLIPPVNDHFAFVTSQLNLVLKEVPEDRHTLVLELMK